MPGDRLEEAARSVYRAAAAAALSQARYSAGGPGPEAICRQAWPSDARALGILHHRAATAPATTGTAGWAAELAIATTTGAFFANLPQSAAAQLFASAVRLPLDGLGQIRVPFAGLTPSLAPSFVAEAAPIPVRKGAIATVVVAPKKMAVLTSMTSEIADYSAGVAEPLIRAALAEAAARALDVAAFSNAAGDAVRPPGLLFGATPISPTTGSATATDAMLSDVQKLVDAIGAAGGGTSSLTFVASPGRAAKMRVLGSGLVEILGSNAVPADTLHAFDVSGIVTAFTGEPQIDTSRSASVHYDDAPLQISNGGVLASPVHSAFQADEFVLKLIVRCGWGVRPGYAQTMAGIAW